MRSLVPVALFTSAENRKVSLNIGDLRWFCLLFSAYVLLLVFHRELPLICLLLHESAPFSRNFCEVSNSFACVDQLQSEQIFH